MKRFGPICKFTATFLRARGEVDDVLKRHGRVAFSIAAASRHSRVPPSIRLDRAHAIASSAACEWLPLMVVAPYVRGDVLAEFDSTQQLECTVNIDGAGEVMITVRDPGPGFDPKAVADPLAPENVLKPSGRGIFLINGLMDDVEFADGGRELRMRKKKQ